MIDKSFDDDLHAYDSKLLQYENKYNGINKIIWYYRKYHCIKSFCIVIVTFGLRQIDYVLSPISYESYLVPNRRNMTLQYK